MLVASHLAVLTSICNMKSFVVLCVVLVAGIQAHNADLSKMQKEKANQYTAECIKETGVKPEVIAEAKKGHISEDEGLKKFTLCFFQKAGILSHDGKLNIDVALSKLPAGVDKADAEKLLESCKSKSGKDAADTAFEIFKCYHHGTKTHILLGF